MNIFILNCHICIYNSYLYLYLQLYFNYVVYIYLEIYVFDMLLNLGDVIWGKQAQPVNLYQAQLSYPSLTPLQLNF